MIVVLWSAARGRPLRDEATYRAGRVLAMDLRYDWVESIDWSAAAYPTLFLDGTKLGALMEGRKGVLLDFRADEPMRPTACLWSNRIVYVAGEARDRLGLTALLVRPDGIVAWASDATDCLLDAAQVASRWFGQPTEETPA